MTRSTVLALVVALGSCSRELAPTGQVVLYIDTDAIVPEPASTPANASRLSPLVDRARFEVLVDGKTEPGSTRDFAIDAGMFRDRKVSFGIVPPPSRTNVTARVLLFRADRVVEGVIEPGIALETIVNVPPVPTEGVVEVFAVLRTDDFGVKVGPINPSSGPPQASVVGTWRGGGRVPCGGSPRPGEVCVPGGAFFFGNPQFRGRTTAADIDAERLVVVSPFYLDLTEVTVGDLRKALPALNGVPAPKPGVANDAVVELFCTWTDAPGKNENAPANCVTWDTARAYCRDLGKDLLTEAQIEFVTSGLGEEWAFPWGNDEPDCRAAMWGRAGVGVFTEDPAQCREPGAPSGPAFPCQGASDKLGSNVLRNAGGEPICDLGGNLSEWALDTWARPTDPFWSTSRPMIDPLNITPSPTDGDGHAVRGGNWFFSALTTRAGFRRRRLPTEIPYSVGIGFRCARPGVER